MLARLPRASMGHAVLLTPSVLLRLSQLPRYNQKKDHNQNEHCIFHSPYTLPSSVSRKSFPCHSCENCRGVYQQFPFWNSRLDTLHSTQLLSFHILAHSFALFCTHPKLNPFLFKRFRTLCQNTRVWGTPLLRMGRRPRECRGGIRLIPTSLLRYLLTSLPPETAAPFPQRWGQLRKGRSVFRREDRYRSKTQFSGGGGGGGRVVRNFPRWPCSMV
jgi:hypothetical protein